MGLRDARTCEMSSSEDAGAIVGVVIAVLAFIFLAISFWKSFIVVREKQQVVLERCGRFRAVLTPGVHMIMPWIDAPKKFSVRYYLDSPTGETVLVQKLNQTRIVTQDEILDLPRQSVITRDNASISLDVLLSYKVVNPKQMMYSCVNLPRLMHKVLQAHVRAVAGSLDVDSIIEETATMDRVAGELGAVASRWGVAVSFVRFQKVDAGGLTDVLAKRKNADLENQSIIIRARATKQKAVIEAEGNRDRVVREAEGEAQQMKSRARGEAKAITNSAAAEADAVREVARAIARTGENPTRYLLALKYIDALRSVVSRPSTAVRFLPRQTSHVQTMGALGATPAIVTSA